MVNDEEVESKDTRPNNISGLVDDLLVEILCRLASYKNIVICKSVCKRWTSLLSHPILIRRFIAAHICGGLKYLEFGVVVRKMDFSVCGNYCNDNTSKGLMIRFNDAAKNVYVSPLPRLSTFTVMGACHDLLLYSIRENCLGYSGIHLFIINAQTQHYVALPSLHLPTYPTPQTAKHIAFICDPYYSIPDTTTTTTTPLALNDAYCACVVAILHPLKPCHIRSNKFVPTDSTEFPARLLSRNTQGTWRNVVLSLPVSCRPMPRKNCSYLCVGRKYYFRCDRGIICFDPFTVDDNDVIKCDFLPLPQPYMSLQSTFGAFNKILYMCDYHNPDPYLNPTYRVWALDDDYETGFSWSLRHNIPVNNWITRNSPLLDNLIDREKHVGEPIGFHPANPDIIYMLSQHWIILCNFATREIQIVSKLSEDFHDFYPDAFPYPITLPVWPSPLPTF